VVGAAKATYYQTWEQNMLELKEINTGALVMKVET